MMLSADDYNREIMKYDYSKLIEEQRRLFKHILELELKIVLDDCHLADEFIDPDYKIQLSYNREYLIVLEKLLKRTEDENRTEEIKQFIKNALDKGEIINK